MKWKAAFLAAVGFSQLYGANLLINSGFEAPVIGGGNILTDGTGGSAITGWTTTGATCGGNCVLIIDTNYVEGSNIGTITFNANSGQQSLDLTGAGQTLDGGVLQTVALTVGQQYDLSFWVGNQDDAASFYGSPSGILLLIDGVAQSSYYNTLNTPNSVNWFQFATSFIATQANTTIEFRNSTALQDNFAGLDDVFLDVTPGAEAPEPGTFALMAAGLAGVTAWHRRRRSA